MDKYLQYFVYIVIRDMTESVRMIGNNISQYSNLYANYSYLINLSFNFKMMSLNHSTFADSSYNSQPCWVSQSSPDYQGELESNTVYYSCILLLNVMYTINDVIIILS